MFSGLLIILVPLIVGYLIPLRHKAALQLINRLLSWIVYLILFFMGISLAFLDNLASNLVAIFIIPPSVLRLFYCVISLPYCGWNVSSRGVTIISRKNCLRVLPWRWSRCNCAA